MIGKRFIEETFPVKEVSEISAQEKNIRHGHISTLHIWWARRPLAASRSTAFASLIPFPEDEETINYFWSVLNPLFNKGILPKEKRTENVVDAIRSFIIEMSRWENSNNKELVEASQNMILHFNKGIAPKVLDPFGGGGSIPLECLRLGCETYSNDLNPVAVLIQKCTLEYPHKYGKPGYVEREVEEIENGEYVKKKKQVYVENVLLHDFEFWGKWILKEAKEELEQFYPHNSDGSKPVGYIWARTIPCQNPACGAEIPLMRQFWLVKKDNKKVALYPFVKSKKVEFKIVGEGYEKWPEGFNPEDGTVTRAVATCLVCKSTIEANITRELFINGKSSSRMVSVVLIKSKIKGKFYRIVNDTDMEGFKKSESYLTKKEAALKNILGYSPIPDEPTPDGKGSGAERAFSLRNYKLDTWGELFNFRQKLSLIIFLEKIILLENKLKSISTDDDYLKAISAYLSLSLDKLADHNSTHCAWVTNSETNAHPFMRNSLGMVWDYSELMPFGSLMGCWEPTIDWLIIVLKNLEFSNYAVVSQNSATNLKIENSFADCVFTDPPYYDNVPYSYLSDFYYVWLKRSLGNVFPELFSTLLTPKNNEIVVYANNPGGFQEGVNFFETNLKKSFIEINRILKINGLAIIVYAHKSTDGWESLINSLLESNLTITSAWPLNTEREGRPRQQKSAAFSSSIYLICRKIERQPTAFYNDVKEETKNYLGKKLDRLWNEGISGADFFIAAIGSSIEVFGKYESVIDYEGNVVRANRLLEDVRIIVTDYAVKKILHNGFATGISDLTRFYVLCRWEFKAAKIPFDEVNKLAHSCHIELADFWQTKSLIKKDKEFVLILGPQDREIEDIKDSGELIDVLHYAIKLWEKGKKSEMQKVLNETGYAKSDAFFRVAQAIAETLPNESKEKKLLEGFLNLRDKISESFQAEGKDKDLFD